MFEFHFTAKIRNEDLKAIMETLAPILSSALVKPLVDELVAKHLAQLPEPPTTEWIDINECALLLHRDRSRVYKYLRSGLLTGYTIHGLRGIRLKKHEVEASISKLDLSKGIHVKANNF